MKYIVDYDIDGDESQGRATALAGVDKAKYIIEGIVSTGKRVEIISPAGTRKKSGYVSKKTDNIDENTSIRLFSTFGTTNKILKGIRYYLLLIKLFIYLYFNTKKGEKIIVYHTIKVSKIIFWLKKLKKFYLILQVEEIYSNVNRYKKSLAKYEYKVMEIADAYIFPTKMLNDKINKDNKPYIIVHGTYHTEEKFADKFNDGKIHCVYAGTFDATKGGARMAINAARYLNEKYHIHIIGFGTEDEKGEVIKLIDEVSKASDCKVTFDGLKKGEEYKKFLQSCHIGLSTQNPEKEFNNTSFPSKVLSYMANGLKVVTVKIPVIESAKIHEHVFYYNEVFPENIAEAIMGVDINDSYDSKEVLSVLDKSFKKDMKDLLGDR